MRVGEILLHHGWVDWETLAVAVSEQAASGASGLRLCSLLVAQGSLAFDHASRALGEQLGVAAALRKHLVHRDKTLASLIPADIARGRIAIPIGRLGDRSLIVCARDPSPALHDSLIRLVGGEIVLAVAPARYLEQLVEDVYAPRREIDVPIVAELGDDGNDIEIEIDTPPSEDIEIDIEVPTQPAKAQRPASSALPVAIKTLAAQGKPITRDALDVTIASLADIDDLEWLLEVVMAFLASRFRTSLLFELRERRAVGIRGHGKKLTPVVVRTFVLDLDESAIVRRARDERRVIDESPAELGSDDDAMVAALETDAWIAAAIVKGSSVSHVLVVGEPVVSGSEPASDREATAIDIGLLAEAIGDTLSRM